MPRKPVPLILPANAAFMAAGFLAHRWEGRQGPIAAPFVGGMLTSSIAVLVLLPVLFMTLKERQLRRGTLRSTQENGEQGAA